MTPLVADFYCSDFNLPPAYKVTSLDGGRPTFGASGCPLVPGLQEWGCTRTDSRENPVPGSWRHEEIVGVGQAASLTRRGWWDSVCYQTRLGSTGLMAGKANLLMPGCGEGKCNIYCKAPDLGSSKEKGQLVLRRPDLSDWFQGRDFKGKVRGVAFGVTDQLTHNQLPSLPYSDSYPENNLTAAL